MDVHNDCFGQIFELQITISPAAEARFSFKESHKVITAGPQIRAINNKCIASHQKYIKYLPRAIGEPLSDCHLTSSPEHHPQLVTLQHKVEATGGSQVQGR